MVDRSSIVSGVSGSPPGGDGLAAPATPAATVVCLRDGEEGLEVLMVRRSSGGTYSGMWVFPGGQVDPADLHGAAGEVEVARRAAVREAREEAGLRLDAAQLVPLSFWMPPAEVHHRFATWFFVTAAAAAGDVVVDDTEIRDHRWVTPSAAMAARDAGHIELVAPTYMTLWWLSRYGDVASALTAAAAEAPERYCTRFVRGARGVPVAGLWEGDAGYRDSNLDRPGPRRRLIMAPGGWRVEMSARNTRDQGGEDPDRPRGR